jgi:hypothetical protein
VEAAKTGCAYVELQIQYEDAHPLRYRATALNTIQAIRQTSKTIPILAGLAPDAGGTPVSVYDMVQDYSGVYGLVAGYWLNADTWSPPRGTGCAVQGCPQVVRGFLKATGLVP